MTRPSHGSDPAGLQLLQMSLAVEQSPVGVTITDRAGRIEYVNPSFCQINGCTAPELLGRSLESLWGSPEGRDACAAMFGDLAADNNWDGEFVGTRGNGEPFDQRVLASPIRQPDGRTTHYLFNQKDVSDFKRSSAELRRYQGHLEELVAERTAELEHSNRTLAENALELERSNRELESEIARREAIETSLRQTLEDLEAFSYTVSHDLRSPLAVIGGFAGAVLQSEADNLSPAARHRLDRVVAGARKMEKMIDDILAYSRTSEDDMRVASLDMNTLVAEVAAEAQQAYPRAAVLLGPLPGLSGDDGMLRQVFANLLGNALKFSAGRADPCVEVGSACTDRSVEIFVRDNGSGFDMAYADKLFGLFKRLHSQQEFAGSGVGLAIVKRLVGRHGGEVRAESVPGGWTTFTVSLPLDCAALQYPVT